MPVIMCTKDLWKRMGRNDPLPARAQIRETGCQLAAWSARAERTDAGNMVVALEESTYLTVVCPLVPLPMFVRVFAASLGAALDVIGVPPGAVDIEVEAVLDRTTFAKNDNRSLLGSVNDVAFHAQVLLEGSAVLDLARIGYAQHKLNQMPHVRREPAFPDEAVRLLFQVTAGVH